MHVRRVTNPLKQKILNIRTKGNIVISKRNLTNKLKVFKFFLNDNNKKRGVF